MSRLDIKTKDRSKLVVEGLYHAVLKTYEEYLEKPLSHRAHELLHTDLSTWEIWFLLI